MEAICRRTTATSKLFPFKKSTKAHGLKRRRIPKMDRKMTKDSDQDSSEREKRKIKMAQTNGRMLNFTHKKCKK